MKILLVTDYPHDGLVSMRRFAALMAKGLKDAGQDVRTCCAPQIFGRLKPSNRGVGKWLGYVDKFVAFPRILCKASEWADVVHVCDHSNSMYVKYLGRKSHVVTCHDLTAVKSAQGKVAHHTRWTGRRLQHSILRGLGNAQHVICVSDATRADLLRMTNISEGQVSRSYNAMNYSYSPMEPDHAARHLSKIGLSIAQPFFLHVGGNQWYKNRLGLLRIFASLRELNRTRNHRLVLVGKPWTKEMRRFVVEKDLRDTALELTGIGNEELRALYSTAYAFVFPSLEEGFGWPILEAQACGCPVIATRHPALQEIGGDAAFYIDLENPAKAAALIEQNLDLLPARREAGLCNAARFQNSPMIDEYLSVYEKVFRERVPVVHSSDWPFAKTSPQPCAAEREAS